MAAPQVTPSKLARLSALVSCTNQWFVHHARPLPWRRKLSSVLLKHPERLAARPAYVVWISELMLQQTQVKTVLPYYENWMRQFPNLKTFSDAQEEQALFYWQGLGYYSRVKNALKTAVLLHTEHQAQFPQSFKALCALPGVGKYTAGAIRSFAFHLPTPAVDANVERVLARFFALASPIQKLRSTGFFEDLLQRVLAHFSLFAPAKGSKESLSLFLEALIEIGATLCLPIRTPSNFHLFLNPGCLQCPLKDDCGARLKKQVAGFPKKLSKPPSQKVFSTAFLLRLKVTKQRSSIPRFKFLLEQKQQGLLAGLWQFPTLAHHRAELTLKEKWQLFQAQLLLAPSPPVASPSLPRLPKQLLSAHDFLPLAPKLLGHFQHSYTKYRVRLGVYVVAFEAARFSSGFSFPQSRATTSKFEWFFLETLTQLAVSAVTRRVIDALAALPSTAFTEH